MKFCSSFTEGFQRTATGWMETAISSPWFCLTDSQSGKSSTMSLMGILPARLMGGNMIGLELWTSLANTFGLNGTSSTNTIPFNTRGLWKTAQDDLGCWASGLRRRTVDPVFHGFESRTPRHRFLAQWLAHHVYTVGVGGSSPSESTTLNLLAKPRWWRMTLTRHLNVLAVHGINPGLNKSCHCENCHSTRTFYSIRTNILNWTCISPQPRIETVKEIRVSLSSSRTSLISPYTLVQLQPLGPFSMLR